MHFSFKVFNFDDLLINLRSNELLNSLLKNVYNH